jgi:hypothetical protein
MVCMCQRARQVLCAAAHARRIPLLGKFDQQQAYLRLLRLSWPLHYATSAHTTGQVSR